MAKSLPRYFKMLQLDIYDRSTDLVDHLESFEVLMLLHRAMMEYYARPSFLHSESLPSIGAQA